MNDTPDIKLDKKKSSKLANLWKKIKFYAIVLLLLFLAINSDLYDITIVKEDNQIIYELCIDRTSLKKGLICTKSLTYLQLN